MQHGSPQSRWPLGLDLNSIWGHIVAAVLTADNNPIQIPSTASRQYDNLLADKGLGALVASGSLSTAPLKDPEKPGVIPYD
jgi:hypothetical protein